MQPRNGFTLFGSLETDILVQRTGLLVLFVGVYPVLACRHVG
jgi:hypothetical protein